jgi:hypothetical protein
MRSIRRTLVLAALLLVVAQAAHAQSVFWVETNYAAPEAHRALADGNGLATFVLGPATLPEGLAFHEGQDKVYWVEAAWTGARILRAHPDWTGVQVLVGGGSAFRGLALDETGGKMYWTSSNLSEGAKIRRANLDGSGVQVLVDLGTAGSNPRGIALDVAGGKMYWADLGLEQIRRANLDGSSPETVASVVAPWGIAIDPSAAQLYWSNPRLGNITRMPLAGGPGTKVRSGLDYPTYLTLDVPGGMMYWIEAGAGGQKLRRSNLVVGGSTQDLLAVSTYGGLAFSPQPLVDVPVAAPVTEFALGPVMPNPAAGATRIEFALPRAARVRLVAVDVRGRQVATILDQDLPAGAHHATWSGRAGESRAAAGIYFLRFEAPGIERVRKVVLLP